jgi:lipoprotein NlpI
MIPTKAEVQGHLALLNRHRVVTRQGDEYRRGYWDDHNDTYQNCWKWFVEQGISPRFNQRTGLWEQREENR